jgi:hypothetical protein
MTFLTQNTAKLCKILIITLFFLKNAIFSQKKLTKIAENCDHNIDPGSPCLQIELISILLLILPRPEVLANLRCYACAPCNELEWYAGSTAHFEQVPFYETVSAKFLSSNFGRISDQKTTFINLSYVELKTNLSEFFLPKTES